MHEIRISGRRKKTEIEGAIIQFIIRYIISEPNDSLNLERNHLLSIVKINEKKYLSRNINLRSWFGKHRYYAVMLEISKQI